MLCFASWTKILVWNIFPIESILNLLRITGNETGNISNRYHLHVIFISTHISLDNMSRKENSCNLSKYNQTVAYFCLNMQTPAFPKVSWLWIKCLICWTGWQVKYAREEKLKRAILKAYLELGKGYKQHRRRSWDSVTRHVIEVDLGWRRIPSRGVWKCLMGILTRYS